jgi:hypothetical protein
MSNEFSELTIDITKQLSKIVKKEQGIFITPKTIIKKLVEYIKQYFVIDNINKYEILEPSCGTCEIVKYIDELFENIEIDAIENNEFIFDKIKNISFKNNVNLQKCDFIKYVTNKLYDMIIANPPYLVIDKNNVPENYNKYIIGRPNLFGLFIIHSLSMLKPNGILAFIIPKSFLNSSYYSTIRNYMKQNGEILNIIDFEKDGGFIDTKQSTFGLIYRKTDMINNPTECNYSIKFNNNFMFSQDANSLRQILNGSTTLSKLGLFVKTGNIVWNQRKSQLTNDNTKTLLLYNSNISKNNTISLLDFSNDEKKQYIDIDGVNDTVIVVNRGNGNSAYKLNYSLVNGSQKYLVENHLNVIYSPSISGNELKALFNKIIKSFENPKTQQFIHSFLGNNGLSKTELEIVFPIYL